MATNVPAPVFADTGLSTPAEADLFAGFFADLQAAFGGDLAASLSTPQGQLATSSAAARAAVDAIFLGIVNGVDPAFASGRMQDAIARIYFLTRNPPLPTIVTALCFGAAGTVIPAGSLAIATDNTIYQTTGTVTIGQFGSVPANFAALDTGPIACPAGALSTIYRAVPGWDAVSNSTAGIAGRDVESRVDFETRRQGSVAINALGILPSVRASVLGVDGVLDAFVTENSSADNLTTGGVTLRPHSLYVAVEGGTDADVARAIWRKKAPGCDYNGNVTVTIEDTSSGYVPPYPTYAVTFQRPSALPTFFSVTLASSSAVPSDAVTQVRNAIVAAFSGDDGGQRVRIGTTVYASRYYAGVASLGPWAQIIGLRVGSDPGSTSDSMPVRVDQFPTLDPSNIAVTLA